MMQTPITNLSIMQTEHIDNKLTRMQLDAHNSVATALAVATSAYFLSLYHHADRLVGSKAKVVILFLRSFCMLRGRKQPKKCNDARGTDKPIEGNNNQHDSLDTVTFQVTDEKVKVKSAGLVDLQNHDDKEMTWKDAAVLLDSVCLRVFSVIMVGMTLVFAFVLCL